VEIVLQRGDSTGKSIPGELKILDNHVAWTLERPAVAIPAGRFPIELYFSPHFNRMMPRLKDVPERSNIEIHWGDFPTNSDGCILVGEQRSLDAIWYTQDEFKQLFTMLEAAVKSEGCWIMVLDPPQSNAEDVEAAATGEND